MGVKFFRLLLLVCCALSAPGRVAATVYHDLRVRIDPPGHRIDVVDRVTLPEGFSGPIHFLLHAGLEPKVLDLGAKLLPAGLRDEPAGMAGDATPPVEQYSVELPEGVLSFSLEYGGEIHHPVRELGAEYARSFGSSPGLIGPEGVFLAGPSYWYPQLEGQMLSFELSTRLPAGWRSVSQGRRSRRESFPEGAEDTWTIETPQEEIYLIAADYTEYVREAGGIAAMVFLRGPDEELAQRYLEATSSYLAMYQHLLGPYPYAKFALVENFWETGYGMPSFTLLGPKVIRLPFILYSSYPHEILHNWWGNGVYVDYATGNWSEGLTSYLADHLIKEQRGQGAEYRRAALQRYADYVRGERDFPLREFRARHSASTQAVGYGKSMMLFHMLRQELGDPLFVAGLQRFYRDYVHHVAGFDDLEQTFSAVAGRSLAGFFDQWVERTGAPALRVSDTAVEPTPDGFRLSARVEQAQPGDPYRLLIPVAVRLEGRDEAWQTKIEMDSRSRELVLDLPARPLRLELDPEFDLFRRLDRREIPPALSQAFGAERALVVLPGSAPQPLLGAWRRLAEEWRHGREDQLQIRLDSDLEELPADAAVWLFGWENRFRGRMAQALAAYPFGDLGDAVVLAKERVPQSGSSLVVVAHRPGNPDEALAWVASDQPTALPGLGRKLPHYGKYSYLVFSGEEPENQLKGQWPVVGSPLALELGPGGAEPARLAPRAPLAELPPVFSAARMGRDVERLAAEDMQGRGLGTKGLARAAEYVAEQFREAGLRPAGDGPGDFFQTWTERSGPESRPEVLRNVVGLVPGSDPQLEGQLLVIGAHYDHLGLGWPDVRAGAEGKLHPGADDNASGVAVLLELARVLADSHPARSLALVAFTGEEAGRLGSRHYLEALGPKAAQRVVAMLNLDTVGRLGAGQLLVLAAGSAREWGHILRGAGYVTGVDVKPVDQQLDASDQVSFHAAGIPAVQFFTGATEDYHRPTDTADRVDTAGLVKVAAVVKEVAEYLSARPEPLTSSLGPAPDGDAPARPSSGRSVSLGSVPDFAYSGEGVRLSGVVPGSPAAAAGLAEGDLIVGMAGHPVRDLRELSAVLRGLSPGDRVEVRFLRGGEEHGVTATLVAR